MKYRTSLSIDVVYTNIVVPLILEAVSFNLSFNFDNLANSQISTLDSVRTVQLEYDTSCVSFINFDYKALINPLLSSLFACSFLLWEDCNYFTCFT